MEKKDASVRMCASRNSRTRDDKCRYGTGHWCKLNFALWILWTLSIYVLRVSCTSK